MILTLETPLKGGVGVAFLGDLRGLSRVPLREHLEVLPVRRARIEVQLLVRVREAPALRRPQVVHLAPQSAKRNKIQNHRGVHPGSFQKVVADFGVIRRV